LIVPVLPEVFAEFRGKRFALLWRGSLAGVLAEAATEGSIVLFVYFQRSHDSDGTMSKCA
jgi:hypothetical protein